MNLQVMMNRKVRNCKIIRTVKSSNNKQFFLFAIKYEKRANKKRTI